MTAYEKKMLELLERQAAAAEDQAQLLLQLNEALWHIVRK